MTKSDDTCDVRIQFKSIFAALSCSCVITTKSIKFRAIACSSELDDIKRYLRPNGQNGAKNEDGLIQIIAIKSYFPCQYYTIQLSLRLSSESYSLPFICSIYCSVSYATFQFHGHHIII